MPLERSCDIFQVRVHAPNGEQPKLAWRASEQDSEEMLPPSTIPYHVHRSVVPGWTKEFTSAVAPAFSLSPDGKTLEDLAFESGVWQINT
jgi:hypothetical protein